MPGEDVLQLQVLGATAGQPVANFFHYKSSVEEAETNPLKESQAFIEAWDTKLRVLYLAMLPDDYVLHGYKCRRVNNTGGPTAAKPVADNGTRGENAIASGTGPLIVGSFYTGTKWKTSRCFVPGVAVGDLVGNAFDAALITAVEAFITEFNESIDVADPATAWNVGVFHADPEAFHLITEHTVSLLVATQRRRYRPV